VLYSGWGSKDREGRAFNADANDRARSKQFVSSSLHDK
jgi:hypothetical protein